MVWQVVVAVQNVVFGGISIRVRFSALHLLLLVGDMEWRLAHLIKSNVTENLICHIFQWSIFIPACRR